MSVPAFRVPSPPPRLAARLARAAAQVAGSALASVTLAVPELADAVPRRLPAGGACMAGRQGALLALGPVRQVESGGPERLAELDRARAAWWSGWRRLDPDGVGDGARAFVGFAFDPAEDSGPFPNACLRLPAALLEQGPAGCRLTLSAGGRVCARADTLARAWGEAAEAVIEVLAPPLNGVLRPRVAPWRVEAVPTEGEWLDQVAAAVEAIGRGDLHKVVLSRRLTVRAAQPLDPARLLAWLARRYPGCTCFALDARGAALVGASPERLVRVAGGRVLVDAVAGTACDRSERRHTAAGPSLEALLTDLKSRREHELVVAEVLRTLAPVCHGLRREGGPRLLHLPGLQHLWTPVCGVVRSGVTLLDLAARLHPTPAVGGAPRGAALEHLAGERRGWYTGAIGWVGPRGEGELAVVLRCALLRGQEADLYAGAGIVADSRPEAELAETEWKLRTMLDALAQA